MTHPVLAAEDIALLRVRAASQLSPIAGTPHLPANAGAATGAAQALAVLHALASSPATAIDALALLHELQVHQVELELQAEELRDSRAELEATLERQITLYDKQPVACFSLDRRGAVTDLNLGAAAMLGIDRGLALGQPFESYFAADSASALQSWLTAAGVGEAGAVLTLQLASPPSGGRAVTAHLRTDPADQRCLAVLVEVPAAPAASSAAARR